MISREIAECVVEQGDVNPKRALVYVAGLLIKTERKMKALNVPGNQGVEQIITFLLTAAGNLEGSL